MTYDFKAILSKNDYLALPPQEQEKYVRRQLREILKSHKNGITISEIDEKTPFTRPTIIKHLERFASTREGFRRKVGTSFVYYPNGSSVYPDKIIKTEISKDRAYRGAFINNNFGEYVFIEEVGVEGIAGGSFMIKKDEFSLFKEFIEKLTAEVAKWKQTR